MHGKRAAIGAMLTVFFFASAMLGSACKKKDDANADAAADAAMEAAVGDAAPGVEDAAVEAAAPVPTAVKTAAPAGITGLPKSCVDSKGGLGTLTFAVSGNNVTITSSNSKAKATCVKKDDTTLSCDWLDKDGKPSVTGRKVTFGAHKAIGGNYDTKNIFSCPPQ